MDSNNNNLVTCPLCGHIFNESEASAGCEKCPLQRKSCGNVKCPNCNYDFPLVKTELSFKWLARVLNFFSEIGKSY